MVYADSRGPAEKLEAGRAYLKLLDKKIIRLRKAGKAALVKKMQAEKKSTIARMKGWKAEVESGAPSAPVAPRPPASPSARPVAAGEALFGLGLNTGYSVGYVAGNSIVAARGDLILADALAIGPMLGLSEDAVSWKVGLGAATGKDINDKSVSSIPLFVDGVVAIPADLLGGIASYVGGGLNYALYGSRAAGTKRLGSVGGQVYYGIQGDVGLGGTSYAELAYSIVRSGNTNYSMKGIGINFGTTLVL
ncbi:hypothetical protein ACFL31_04200 [Candidatus Margulisiibacteriota bacterium]